MNNNLDYLIGISTALRKGVNSIDLADSMSATQFQSKLWLVNNLSSIPNTSNKVIMILGSWYGMYLVPMIKQLINPRHIILNDINSEVLYYAEWIHGKTNMSYKCFDVSSFPEMVFNESPDIVINTSCEHMNDMSGLVKFLHSKDIKPLYALQVCDSRNDPGHINPKATLHDFICSTLLQNLLFQGTLNLGHKKRFMVIGHS